MDIREAPAYYEGMQTAVNLIRAGATVDVVAALLPGGDPARADPPGYQERLRELRQIMSTDAALIGGA